MSLSIKFGAPQIIISVLILIKFLQLYKKDSSALDVVTTVLAAGIEVGLLVWGGFY